VDFSEIFALCLEKVWSFDKCFGRGYERISDIGSPSSNIHVRILWTGTHYNYLVMQEDSAGF